MLKAFKKKITSVKKSKDLEILTKKLNKFKKSFKIKKMKTISLKEIKKAHKQASLFHLSNKKKTEVIKIKHKHKHHHHHKKHHKSKTNLLGETTNVLDIKKHKKSIFAFNKTHKKNESLLDTEEDNKKTDLFGLVSKKKKHRKHHHHRRKHPKKANKSKKTSKSILSILGGEKDDISLNSSTKKATLDLGNGHHHRSRHHHHRKHKGNKKKSNSILNMFVSHEKAIKNAHTIIEKVLLAIRESDKDKKLEPLIKQLELVSKSLETTMVSKKQVSKMIKSILSIQKKSPKNLHHHFHNIVTSLHLVSQKHKKVNQIISKVVKTHKVTDDQFTKILISLKKEADRKYKIERKATLEERKTHRVFKEFKHMPKVEDKVDTNGFRMACQRKNLLTINKMIKDTEQDTSFFVK